VVFLLNDLPSFHEDVDSRIAIAAFSISSSGGMSAGVKGRMLRVKGRDMVVINEEAQFRHLALKVMTRVLSIEDV